MKSLRRWFKVVFVLLVLLMIALFAFVVTFDANNYKSQIVEQVEAATGRTFSIGGEIDLSIFPWIGLKVDNVALGNKKGFEGKQLAAIKQLDIQLSLLPLLKKVVKVKTIRLHGLEIALEVAKDKSNNWSDLSEINTAEDSSVEKKETLDEANVNVLIKNKTQSDTLESLSIEGVEFVDAVVHYEDRSSNTISTVSKLNLKTSEIKFNSPVDIDLDANIHIDQPVIDARFNLTTQLNFNQKVTALNLTNFVVTVLVSANKIFHQDEKIKITSAVSVLLDEQHASLKNTQITALGVIVNADFQIRNLLDNPTVHGLINIPLFNAQKVASRVSVALPDMADGSALQQVGLKTKVKLDANALEANDIRLVFDGSHLTGWLHVPSISKQQIRYHLLLDQLDLNHYLPPLVDENNSNEVDVSLAKENSAQSRQLTGDEKIELPVELMRALDVQGDFRVSSLILKDVSIKQLLMSSKVANGLMIIDPLSMNVLDGAVESSLSADMRQALPSYQLKLNVDQVTMGPIVNPFLKNVMGKKEMSLNGAADLVVELASTGDTINQLKKSSVGNVALDMKETEINGFDPEFYMRSSVADYLNTKGLGLSKTVMGSYSPREVTVFDLIHGKVNLVNGIAHTDDFFMDSKRVKIGAEGDVDIVNNTLDIISSIKLARDKTALEKVMDSPLFVRMHGSFDELKYDLDSKRLRESTSNALKNEVKNKANEKAKKALKKHTDKFQDKLRNKLKGLF